jgi:quinol monooxygenase YgiN
MSKGISFYINFHIKEEYIDTWKEAAFNVLDSMASEDTFISAYLHRDANDPTHFTLYEKWDEPVWSKCPRTFSSLEPIKEWHK